MSERLVTVFGGSGFIGRYVVQRLAARGDRVRVAVRKPNEALFLKPLGAVGQVEPMACNLNHADSVRRALAGATHVVNLVGVLYDSGSQTFDKLHTTGAGLVAAEAMRAGVKTLVHVSAIGADAESDAHYGRSKALGETAVLEAFPHATILRPSVVIGPEDGFFNRFAKLAQLLPILPIPGCETRFQPVAVGDVADAIVTCLKGDKTVSGKIFELGGPQILTLREMLEMMMDVTTVHRTIVNIPFGLASFQAAFLGLLPSPPLTLDQVRLLKHDNVVDDKAKGFKALGIKPTPIAALLPAYCVQYRPKGQFTKV